MPRVLRGALTTLMNRGPRWMRSRGALQVLTATEPSGAVVEAPADLTPYRDRVLFFLAAFFLTTLLRAGAFLAAVDFFLDAVFRAPVFLVAVLLVAVFFFAAFFFVDFFVDFFADFFAGADFFNDAACFFIRSTSVLACFINLENCLLACFFNLRISAAAFLFCDEACFFSLAASADAFFATDSSFCLVLSSVFLVAASFFFNAAISVLWLALSEAMSFAAIAFQRANVPDFFAAETAITAPNQISKSNSKYGATKNVCQKQVHTAT